MAKLTKVGSKQVNCSKGEVVHFKAKNGDVFVNAHEKKQEVELAGATYEMLWKCGGDTNRLKNEVQFDVVDCDRDQAGATTWTMFTSQT